MIFSLSSFTRKTSFVDKSLIHPPCLPGIARSADDFFWYFGGICTTLRGLGAFVSKNSSKSDMSNVSCLEPLDLLDLDIWGALRCALRCFPGLEANLMSSWPSTFPNICRIVSRWTSHKSGISGWFLRRTKYCSELLSPSPNNTSRVIVTDVVIISRHCCLRFNTLSMSSMVYTLTLSKTGVKKSLVLTPRTAPIGSMTSNEKFSRCSNAVLINGSVACVRFESDMDFNNASAARALVWLSSRILPFPPQRYLIIWRDSCILSSLFRSEAVLIISSTTVLFTSNILYKVMNGAYSTGNNLVINNSSIFPKSSMTEFTKLWKILSRGYNFFSRLTYFRASGISSLNPPVIVIFPLLSRICRHPVHFI